jgi:hypothetical protein
MLLAGEGRTAMADFVKYELDDGSEVFFESAEASLVSLREALPTSWMRGSSGTV